MRTIALVVLSCLALFSGGCATTPLYRKYYEEGLYQDVARTFENDSTLWRKPDAVLLAGRLYSDPSMPVYDAERARKTLERLVADFPKSPEAGTAHLILSLLDRLDQLQGELTARTLEMQTAAAAQADTLAASREAAERDGQTLRRRIQRLEADLEQAKQELERLKAIDLRRRPVERR